MSAHQVCVKSGDTKHAGQTFLLNMQVVFSVFDKVREANPVNLFASSGILCASMAPTPYADASHASIKGKSGVKCTV